MSSKFPLEKLQFSANKLLMKGMKLAIGLMPIKDPQLLLGEESIPELAKEVSKYQLKKVLIVTTSGIVKRGQASQLLDCLASEGIKAVVYDRILPDPTFSGVNEALDLLNKENCQAVIAFGGGSAMDAAKVIAVAAANKKKPEKLVGFFKGIKKPLPLFAIPTTAGSGSEATIASVVSDNDTHEKAFIVDSRTVPLVAALDPRLMVSIPSGMTAATGMDALTHAIEAYISTISTKQSDEYALAAIKLILVNLPLAFQNGSNLQARENMAVASFKAGQAFTRSFVGYVHAISHQLGAYYGISHGQANAIVLPYILEFSKKSAEDKFAKLAREIGLGSSTDNNTQLAQQFVDFIYDFNVKLGIPTKAVELKEQHIPEIAKKALKEALLNYPVPRHMFRKDCEQLLRQMLPIAG